MNKSAFTAASKSTGAAWSIDSAEDADSQERRSGGPSLPQLARPHVEKNIVEQSKDMLNSIAELYRVKEVDSWHENHQSRRNRTRSMQIQSIERLIRYRQPSTPDDVLLIRFRSAVRMVIKTQVIAKSTKFRLIPCPAAADNPRLVTPSAALAPPFGFRLSDFRANAAALSMSTEVKRILTDMSMVNRTESQLNMLQNYVSKFKGFAKYTSKVQRELCKVLDLEMFNKGRVILKQGQRPFSFYFIVSGMCEAYRTEQDKDGKLHKRVLGVLNTGDVFGDLALINNTLRTASVWCIEDCELLRVDKEDLDVVLDLIHQQEVLDKLHFIRGTPIGDIMTSAEFAALNNCGVVREMGKNTMVFAEGDVSDSLIFIKRGSVRIVRAVQLRKQILPNGRHMLWPVNDSIKSDSDVPPGDDIVTKLMTAESLVSGQYFGEDELLAHCRRHISMGEASLEDHLALTRRKYNVITNEACEFVEYPRIDFVKCVNEQTLELMQAANTLRPTVAQLAMAYLEQRGWSHVKAKVVRRVVDAKQAARERIARG